MNTHLGEMHTPEATVGRSGDPGPRLVPSHPAAQAWGSWVRGKTKVTWGLTSSSHPSPL